MNTKPVRPTAVLFSALLLAACGGDGDSGSNGKDNTPATAVFRSAADLGVRDNVVVEFSESMDPASLELGGTLAVVSDDGTWSQTTFENDTLTLAPLDDAWDSGLKNVEISVRDAAGNITQTASQIAIRVVFDTFQEAAIVVGQPDFTSNGYHQDGVPGSNTIGSSYGNPGYDTASDILFLPDYDSSRILAFQGIPDVNNANAQFVVGQETFDSVTPGTSATVINGPQTASVHGSKLIVTEYGNNRVSIYAPTPLAGPGTITAVVGQVDKDSAADECTTTGLNTPETHSVTPDGKLIVTDSNNNRVLIWNALPEADGVAADLVLGQGDFTHCSPNDDNQDGEDEQQPSARTLSLPAGVWSDGTRLVVLDNDNSRVLIWNTFPEADFQPADVVLGQSDFVHSEENDADQDGTEDATASAKTFALPTGILLVRDTLIIGDNSNARYLIFEAQ